MGLEFEQPIGSLELKRTASERWAYSNMIDDFRFEATGAVIPTPSANVGLLTMLATVGAISGWKRHRKSLR